MTDPSAWPATDAGDDVDPAPAWEPPADEAPSHSVGDIVDHTYFDSYAGAGGAEVTVRCLVVGVVDVEQQDLKTLEFTTVKGYQLVPLGAGSDPVVDGVVAV